VLDDSDCRNTLLGRRHIRRGFTVRPPAACRGRESGTH